MPTPEHPLVPVDGSIVLFLVVRGPDGRPVTYPMTGSFRAGQLRITTYRKAAKARHLLADKRVCCVIPGPDDDGTGVALRGRAYPDDSDQFLPTPDPVDPTGPAGTTPFIAVPTAVVETVRDRLASSKRMVFRIEVEALQPIGGPDLGEPESP